MWHHPIFHDPLCNWSVVLKQIFVPSYQCHCSSTRSLCSIWLLICQVFTVLYSFWSHLAVTHKPHFPLLGVASSYQVLKSSENYKSLGPGSFQCWSKLDIPFGSNVNPQNVVYEILIKILQSFPFWIKVQLLNIAISYWLMLIEIRERYSQVSSFVSVN